LGGVDVGADRRGCRRGRPAPDLDAQWTSLAGKCRALVRPALGDDRAEELVAAVAGLAELPSARELAAVLR